MVKTIIINGKLIKDIPSFYDEINRVFMADMDWKLGTSLDALNDMLYGGYGEIKGNEPVHLIWENYEQNREDLGIEITRNYYQEKLKYPSTFNTKFVKQKLEELEDGTGQTYFEIILEIIGEHKNIKLIPQ